MMPLNAQNGNTADGCLHTLIACEAILSGKEASNSFFILAWKPEFSFVINTSEDTQDPLTLGSRPGYPAST